MEQMYRRFNKRILQDKGRYKASIWKKLCASKGKKSDVAICIGFRKKLRLHMHECMTLLICWLFDVNLPANLNKYFSNFFSQQMKINNNNKESFDEKNTLFWDWRLMSGNESQFLNFTFFIIISEISQISFIAKIYWCTAATTYSYTSPI